MPTANEKHKARASGAARSSKPGSVGERVQRRVKRIDWGAASASLEERGFARLGRLLSARECAALSALFDRDERFRSTVDMARHRFGEGRYRYFAEPLPAPVAALRRCLYPPLAAIANRWWQELGVPERFPAGLRSFLATCHGEGQARPTPLLLRYGAGGFNCLHQDLYGRIAFPLQATILLSAPQRDFRGGEFLLVEQRPRRQSRGTAIALEHGEGIVFPNAVRPVAGASGSYRAQHRHGVSEVREGVRDALGIIFHDAR